MEQTGKLNELIEALRNCSSPTVGSCMDCPYYKGVSCKWQMMEDAADALEAAEQRIAELEAQMPKQGKWISDLPNRLFENVNHWKCSVCGKHQHFREDYCPNCGARMDGKEKTDAD